MSPRFAFGGRSDVGMQRRDNQDSMYAGPRLIAVADGVGGSAGGEIASRLTITAFMTLANGESADPPADLVRAADEADTAIRTAVDADHALTGMSTTLTAILAGDTAITLAHIGDSRAYRLRSGSLSQLTHDHTFVQTLIDEGQLTEEQARTHPRRSWITRALDGRGRPELDLIPIEVQSGDRYLVCSDGLSGYVDESAITATLGVDDPQRAADGLIELAIQAGGPDNITCIVADPIDDDRADQSPLLGGSVAEQPSARGVRHTAGQPTGDDDEPAVHRRSIGRRLAVVTAVVVLLVVGAFVGTALYIHHQWYVAPDAGQVAVFQGVQGSAAGIQLSHVKERTNLPVSALPQDDRDRVSTGIQASNQSDAQTVVSNLRAEACALVTPSPATASTTAPTTGATRPAHRHHHAGSGGTGTHTPSPKPSPTRTPPPPWCTVSGR
jgi:PPM family protein phosphatase